ncbi:MAG: SRPBCC domain-containing protein [Chitinophagaceae bacterium]
MKDFKKYFELNEEPIIIYQALTNAHTISLWTGEPAVMSTEPGSEFSWWDGSIVGKNLAFEEGKKIEQQWYFDDAEPASIVTIKLHPLKNGGTSLEIRQTNIPDEAFDDISEGWTHTFFRALAEFYGE